MLTFYNDNDPFVCKWLQNLMEAGHIGAGLVLQRGIGLVTTREVRHWGRAHYRPPGSGPVHPVVS